MGLVFQVIWKNLGDSLVFCFWSRILVLLSGFSSTYFERKWRTTCILFFEVAWKNLGDLFCLKEPQGLLLICFWSYFKESREPLDFLVIGRVRSSQEPLLLCFWSNLKKSRGCLVPNVWSIFQKISGTRYAWFLK